MFSCNVEVNFHFLTSFYVFLAYLLILVVPVSAGLPELNIQDANSIKGVAGQIAHDMMGLYNGNQSGQTPGLLPQPYFQWEAGAMLMTMIDYYYYTGDATYNDVVTQGMLWQAGPNNDFMDANQSHVEGNDDQAFWGFAALSAAEQGFQSPPSGSPPWIQLAENLFNDQASRWDSSTCNGGLRWQIFTYMPGYDYKSTIANGALFNIAARLALYTGNDTYAQWANKAYDWTIGAGYVTSDFTFYDGAHTETNCADISKDQWTYNLGVFLHGAATMYSYTGSSDLWKERISGIVKSSSVYNLNNVIYEPSCEPYNTCDNDNYSFKSYLIRWLAATVKLAPFVHDQIMPILQATAKAAATQCTGGASGTMCGMKWTDGKWDGTQGVGQQMGALQAVTAPLIDSCPPIDADKVSPSSPAGSGRPDSTSLEPESSTPLPPSSVGPTVQSVANIALSCSSCSGGSTVISAPSSALASLQSLATASGIAIAQYAAAQAVASAVAAVSPSQSISSSGSATPINGPSAIASGTTFSPSSGTTQAITVENPSVSSPPIPNTYASSTFILGGNQIAVAAIDLPSGSAGAEKTGSAYLNGEAKSLETFSTGDAGRAVDVVDRAGLVTIIIALLGSVMASV